MLPRENGSGVMRTFMVDDCHCCVLKSKVNLLTTSKLFSNLAGADIVAGIIVAGLAPEMHANYSRST